MCSYILKQKGRMIWMKRFKITNDGVHEMTNKAVLNTVTSIEGVEFVIKLDTLMQKRGLSQRELGLITGLRAGTINSILNGKGTTLNKIQLVTLMVGLRITDLSELIEVRFPEETIEEFKQEAETWEETQRRPKSVEKLMVQNVLLSESKE